MKQEVIAKDTNNISDTVRYGLGRKAQLVRNLPCMQIFVGDFFKVQALKAKNDTKKGWSYL